MGMIDKAFELSVVFSAVDRLTGPIDKMAMQLGVLDKRSQQTIKTLNQFKNMAFVGGAITLAGLKMAQSIERGVDQAGEFMTKMIMIRDVTGATADQMERIQKVITQSSGKTIFGVQQTADFARLLGTSGLSAVQVASTLPLFTQFAEVQQLGKGTSPDEAIKLAIAAAHSVGAYDPKQLMEFLDKYNKATFMQPGGTTEFADTFKYLAPKGSGIGMNVDDMLMLSALANRVGVAGSMGGTHAADLLLRAIPGMYRGKKQKAGLSALGIDMFEPETGKFKGITEFVKQLSAAVDRVPNAALRSKYFHDIFGMQGMDLANILSSPRGAEQLKALEDQMKTMKSIEQMQEDTNQSPQGQILQMKTNIENIKLAVFLEMAKSLNPALKVLNSLISKFQDFLDKHPAFAKFLSTMTLFATTVALIVGPLLLIKGVFGYLATAKTIATGIEMLNMALKGTAAAEAALAGTNALGTATAVAKGAATGTAVASASSVATVAAAALPMFLALAGAGLIWFLWNKMNSGFDDLHKKQEDALKNWNTNISPKPVTETELFKQKQQQYQNQLKSQIKFVPGTSLSAPSNPTTVIQKGAINITTQPGQNNKEIAKNVIKEIGKNGRNQSYTRSKQPATMY